MQSNGQRVVKVYLVDGGSFPEVPIEVMPSSGDLLSHVLAKAQEVAGNRLEGLSSLPLLVETDALGAKSAIPVLDLFAVAEDGKAYVAWPPEEVLWEDYRRGLALWDPPVEADELALSNSGESVGWGTLCR